MKFLIKLRGKITKTLKFFDAILQILNLISSNFAMRSMVNDNFTLGDNFFFLNKFRLADFALIIFNWHNSKINSIYDTDSRI